MTKKACIVHHVAGLLAHECGVRRFAILVHDQAGK